MAKKKVIYSRRIVFDIFSNNPIPKYLISDLNPQKINPNNHVINIVKQREEITSGRAAAKMIIDAGFNPMIFQMNDFGNEIEE